MSAKPWTTTELRKASALWAEGKKVDEIAAELGRGRESIKHVTQARRDLFPRRHDERAEIRNDGQRKRLSFDVTQFMHRVIKTEAKRRGVSQNMLIREALRDRFLRKVGAQ